MEIIIVAVLGLVVLVICTAHISDLPEIPDVVNNFLKNKTLSLVEFDVKFSESTEPLYGITRLELDGFKIIRRFLKIFPYNASYPTWVLLEEITSPQQTKFFKVSLSLEKCEKIFNQIIENNKAEAQEKINKLKFKKIK